MNACRYDDGTLCETLNNGVVGIKCRDRNRLEMYDAVLNDVDPRLIACLIESRKRDHGAGGSLFGEMDTRRHAEREVVGCVRERNARGIGAAGGVRDRGDLAHIAGQHRTCCPQGDGGRHPDDDFGESALGNGDLDLTFSFLRQRQNGLPCGDDLSLLCCNVRDDAVRACDEVCVAERVAARRILRDRLPISRFGGPLVRAVLIEHRRRDRLRGIEFLVACALRACELIAGTCSGNTCTRGICLLLHIARVNDHEHVACVDMCAGIYIAREDLPADLKGEPCLVASAHGAAVSCLRRGCVADRHRPYEGRLHLRRIAAAAGKN